MKKNKLLHWVERLLPSGRRENLPVTAEELLISIAIGDEATIRKLLDAGLDPNLSDHMGRLPLHAAVRHSDPVIIRMLVFGGADVNLCNEEECNALMVALEKNDLTAARELLRLGIDLSARNLNLETVFDLAKKSKDQHFLELLSYFQDAKKKLGRLENFEQSKKFGESTSKADRPTLSGAGAKELHIRAKIKSQKDARIKKAQEAYRRRVLKVRNNLAQNNTPEDQKEAAQKLDSKAIADLLGCPNKNRNYALIQAIRQHRNDLMAALFLTGLSLERVEPQTLMTPLAAAIVYKNIEALDLLLKEGVQAESVYKGHSLLFYAIRTGDEDIVKRLLDGGCRLEGKPDSPTPLCLAIKRNEVQLARLLLEAGARVDFCLKGETALKTLIAHGRRKLLPLLLEYKVELNCQRATGRSALSWAMFFKKEAIFDDLLKVGADVNAGREEGRGILTQCIREGANDFLAKLLKSGVDVNIIDEDGKTPLTLAVHQNRPMLVEKLLAAGADRNLLDAEGNSGLSLARELQRDAILNHMDT